MAAKKLDYSIFDKFNFERKPVDRDNFISEVKKHTKAMGKKMGEDYSGPGSQK